jgi:UDP-N-acetylglucosamine pyrophosphorylase
MAGNQGHLGTEAGAGDPEHGISRGRLMPVHDVLELDRVSAQTRQKLQDSLVLVHGGMAQNVGPILEMVTEHYLLRGQAEWTGRREAMKIFDEVLEAISQGDIRRIGELTTRNFEGPLQTIIPWATNRFTDRLIEACRQKYGQDFWGFWMLGGMAGGGMGFIFDPSVKSAAQDWLSTKMVEVKREMQHSLPFAMDPVVYDFEINDNGSRATLRKGTDAVMSPRYYQMLLPNLLRVATRDLTPDRRIEMGLIRSLSSQGVLSSSAILDGLLPDVSSGQQDLGSSLEKLLHEIGFDRAGHEAIAADLRSGRIGLSQNRLAPNVAITDVRPEHVTDLRGAASAKDTERGMEAIAQGRVAVVTLAAGVGSRWTEGAGVCKALHPFARFSGRHRSFMEVHLAKNRRTRSQCGGVIPHVLTTSYLTDQPIRADLKNHDRFGFGDSVYVSTGRSIGLRLIPTVRDLRFEWEEMPQQVLDSQQQKMRQSVRAAWTDWVRSAGEGGDYTDNLPSQCIHPVGHWYEVPNLFRSGVLADLIDAHPRLQTLMLHNIDTLGASVDPAILGRHLDSKNTLSFEVITRRLEDRGGGLALVNGRPRLVEGLAMPDERLEFDLTYYNSMTTWIEIDPLLAFFGLTRGDLRNSAKIDAAVRTAASRLPTYITHKNVKKRWGHGQEDVYPVAQFEKLWGDMTAISDVSSGFFVVPKLRGGQLKEQAQLDGWKRDGTASYIETLCEF